MGTGLAPLLGGVDHDHICSGELDATEEGGVGRGAVYWSLQPVVSKRKHLGGA